MAKHLKGPIYPYFDGKKVTEVSLVLLLQMKVELRDFKSHLKSWGSKAQVAPKKPLLY